MNEIVLNKIKKTYYSGNRELPVLQGISAVFQAGKLSVVLGKSGCGKTTLLRLLAGLDKTDSGEMMLPAGRKVMVFQEPRLMPWLTTLENISLVLDDNLPKEARNKISMTWLEHVGLKSFDAQYPYELSYGMQQRVSLARAFAYNANLIFMDEPFASLDFFTRASMQKLLIDLQKAHNCTIIFVTHSVEEAALLGDTIFLMRHGRLECGLELYKAEKPRNRLSKEVVEWQRLLMDLMEE